MKCHFHLYPNGTLRTTIGCFCCAVTDHIWQPVRLLQSNKQADRTGFLKIYIYWGTKPKKFQMFLYIFGFSNMSRNIDICHLALNYKIFHVPIYSQTKRMRTYSSLISCFYSTIQHSYSSFALSPTWYGRTERTSRWAEMLENLPFSSRDLHLSYRDKGITAVLRDSLSHTLCKPVCSMRQSVFLLFAHFVHRSSNHTFTVPGNNTI